MNAAVRIAKLLARVEQARPPDNPGLPVTDADWLAVFERRLVDGTVASEPDFPRAVDVYRSAIAAAGNAITPPGRFRPDDPPASRQTAWRIAHPHPEVESLWAWLAGMLVRALQGEPAVTEAEFAELAAWFQANESRLGEATKPSDLLELGDGNRESMANLRWGIHKGPRASDAGLVAEKLRKAKARYGG